VERLHARLLLGSPRIGARQRWPAWRHRARCHRAPDHRGLRPGVHYAPPRM